jgi:hypothetical protein
MGMMIAGPLMPQESTDQRYYIQTRIKTTIFLLINDETWEI